MSTSLATIITEFYAIVNQPATSTVYPSSATNGSYVENLANQVQDTICRERKWPFLKKKTMFLTGVPTTTSADLTTASVSVTIAAATGWPTAVVSANYALWIEGDVINFTSRAGLTLSGLTNIDVAHSSGAEIELLYAMPSDFSHNPSLYVKDPSAIEKYIRYELLGEEDDDVDSQDTKSIAYDSLALHWSIVTDKNGNEFIRIHNQSQSNMALLRYYKTAPTMGDAQAATIPDPFALKVIPRRMAVLAMTERGDNPDGLAGDIETKWQTEYDAMKNYYMRRSDPLRPRITNVYRSGIPPGVRSNLLR